MTNICFYFQVHQPYRLKRYTFFDIDHVFDYEDDELNKQILQKVATKCYLTANQVLLDLIKQHHGAFKVAFSISGIAVEQFKKYSPETLASFKALAKTGCVEFINETYYHSLSYLYSKNEFLSQIKMHKELIQREFSQTPTTFRNTELIFNNEIAKTIELLGYKTILVEGTEKILKGGSPNYIYHPRACPSLKALMRNYQLSDDIGFRFSNKEWREYPLTADKYTYWLHQLHGQADIINLFMDYETFGEHHWSDTHIFEFLKALPDQTFRHPEFRFITPSQASEQISSVGEFDCPEFISWADTERDLSAWTGNQLQQDALQALYALEDKVKATNNEELINTWRKLSISDHFYYMSTKWFKDGDVHKYFNPYDSPYDAYIYYQNIICNFEERL